MPVDCYFWVSWSSFLFIGQDTQLKLFMFAGHHWEKPSCAVGLMTGELLQKLTFLHDSVFLKLYKLTFYHNSVFHKLYEIIYRKTEGKWFVTVLFNLQLHRGSFSKLVTCWIDKEVIPICIVILCIKLISFLFLCNWFASHGAKFVLKA